MEITVQCRFLTKKNESEYKNVFNKCFTEQWKESVPFPKDAIYTALLNGEVVGFCFIHDKTPYQMNTEGSGAFLYNLCVDPSHRRSKIASKIMNSVIQKYPLLYSHMDVDSKYHDVWKSNKWARIGLWRNKFVEYVYDSKNQTQEVEVQKIDTRYYDPIENVVYLS